MFGRRRRWWQCRHDRSGESWAHRYRRAGLRHRSTRQSDEYEPQPESTYAPDQPIWLYADFAELAGESIDTEDGDGEDAMEMVAIDLQQTLVVEDPDGNLVVESQETFQEELSPGQLEGYFTGTEILLAGRAATGEYATTLSATDRVSGTQATESATFRIEE